MNDADYRKINDGSHNSSKYHKRDSTATRAILKRDAEEEIQEAMKPKGDKTDE